MKKLVCRMHGKLFAISEENVAMATYAYLGIYKILLLVFNIVPYIALSIIA